ncbi:MAG TPA: Sir2 family NAD-dependent protein deacetylase [Actinomycetota bacterium]|nr:Sir2 family NAD-dependent protein deacetylase [Actinomycetota bacterium]
MADATATDLGEAIARARCIVAFTGAGISTESGIPDFRGPQGVWTKLSPSDFTLSKYVGDVEHRKRVWRMRLERASMRYEPNPAHRALVELERMSLLDCVVTQNVDGLHVAAGSTTVLELHGNPSIVRCLRCELTVPAPDVFARITAGEDDPACTACGGILKSGTILFEEALPDDVLDEAFYRARQCDLCLIVGSSLVVYPAAGVPLEAMRNGARLAIVNAEETPFDAYADVVVRGSAGDVLTAAVEGARRLLTS